MQPQRLAVVVPLYNPGKFLDEIIDSLRICAERVGASVDVFLADDSGESVSDASSYASEQEWGSVTYWRNSENLGEAGNINNAFMRVRGLGHEFALLLHQDDLVSHMWLQFCVKIIEDQVDPEGQLWFCDCVSAEDHRFGELLEKSLSENTPPLVSMETTRYQGKAAAESLYKAFSWQPSGSLFYLDSFFEIGGFYSLLKYCADGDFGVRWLCHGFSMNFTKQANYYRRIHSNQTTQEGIHSGIADQGYAYIMVQYRELAGRRRRIVEHTDWAKRRIVTALKCMRSPNMECVAMHASAFRIIFASLMACISPRFSWLLPKTVKVLLDNAPPGSYSQAD